MNDLKPNHICKNSKCGKLYYACDFCGKTHNWRSMACSPTCYDDYMEEIKIARSKNKPVDLYPHRIDKTHAEVVEMIDNTPFEIINQNTMEQLSDYKEDIENLGLGETIDKINEKLESKKVSKKNK